MRERTVEAYLRKVCKAYGWDCLKWSSPGTRGVPDRIVVTSCHVFFVEVKAPGKKPTKLQKYWIHRLEDRKQHVYVCDCKESVDMVVRMEREYEQNEDE